MKRALPFVLILACAGAVAGPSERITIPPGATFGEVTDSLAAHGMIRSRFWFKVLGRLRGVDREVQAGIYDFPLGAGAWQVLAALTSGRVATVRFTVPEGLTLTELADLAQEHLHIPRDSVLAAASDQRLVQALDLPGPDLEGYLLPETYQLPVDIGAQDLARALAESFTQHWQPEWTERLDSIGLTRAELVTLASIVEGEARHDDERAVIAGVYLNRLRLGMALQADPTVQYAIQRKTGTRKARLYFKDYAIPSPYNTYIHTGLPPAPINSPGLASLEASLYPAPVPYLYFVAGPDGHHVFSRTNREHEAAIARVRKGRR